MKSVSSTELRKNIFKLLDEVLNSGRPLEIHKGGRLLRIIPVEKRSKLQNLVSRPDTILGDPEDLVDISWDEELNLDLP